MNEKDWDDDEYGGGCCCAGEEEEEDSKEDWRLSLTFAECESWKLEEK
jgi:hypothetical protein